MVKLAQEEIDSVSALRSEYAYLAQARGQFEFTKREIERQITELVEAYDEVVKKESSIASELSEKYGTGTINIETGEFIPTSDEK